MSREILRRGLPLGALWLSACAVGPDFRTPEAPAAERYTAEALPAQTAASAAADGGAQTFHAGDAVPARWWTQFGSPKLDALVDTALADSPSLASAQAALRQAQQNLIAQRATLFPTVDANFTADRQKVDLASYGNPNGGAYIYNLYNASVNVSYGLDIWGGTRRGVEASRAAAEASAYETEAAYQTLVANLVTAAINEAEQRSLALGQEWVIADQQRQYTVSERQFGIGAISRSELVAAQSSLAQEQAKLPAFWLAATQAQHLIATYVGRLPSETVASDLGIDELRLPAELPVSLPSDLVRRRPDIRAAEATLHEAAANIGVATANLLPQIALTASFGTQASVFDKLFDGDIFSIGASLTQPLFHAGELTARRRAAIAACDKAQADYRQTVLDAFREVADTLRALQSDAETMRAQVQIAAAAEAQYKLAQAQFDAGGTTRVAVIAARASWTRARAGALSARAARLRDTAALFHALGGDWRTANAADSPSQPAAQAAGAP